MPEAITYRNAKKPRSNYNKLTDTINDQ